MHNNQDDQHNHPEALDRHYGPHSVRRRQGVYHYQRQRGWQPHPHEYTARQRAAERPPGAAESMTGVAPTPVHPYQPQASARRMALPRGTAPLVEAGTIATYDPVSGTAMVRLEGAPTRLIGPARVTACAPRDLTIAGASCLVVLLDPHNPADGVVAALWPPPGVASGAQLTQAGVADVGIAGASAANVAVSFPTPYAGTPVVVATSTDAAWAATVGDITTAGFTLTVSAAATATATVAVEWLACGA